MNGVKVDKLDLIMFEELRLDYYRCYLRVGYETDPKFLFLEKFKNDETPEISFIIRAINNVDWALVSDLLSDWLKANKDKLEGKLDLENTYTRTVYAGIPNETT